MLGTAGDSRSNEPGGNELSGHAQEQTTAYRPHEHPTCQARRDHADTSVAEDADGRKGNEGSATDKTTDQDGSGPRCESETSISRVLSPRSTGRIFIGYLGWFGRLNR